VRFLIYTLHYSKQIDTHLLWLISKALEEKRKCREFSAVSEKVLEKNFPAFTRECRISNNPSLLPSSHPITFLTHKMLGSTEWLQSFRGPIHIARWYSWLFSTVDEQSCGSAEGATEEQRQASHVWFLGPYLWLQETINADR